MAAFARKQRKHVQESASDSEDSPSESESEFLNDDSDVELQKAFAKNQLKPGLNYEVSAPKTFVNNEVELKEKLNDIQLNLDWIERLDVTCDNDKRLLGQEDDASQTEDVHDDFRREMGFYRQAQQAVLDVLPKLHERGIATKRPQDYFAEMAKTDHHMRKVREKLIAKQLSMERSAKAKKLRELRKFGKKVQHEVQLQRQKEKKQLMESVKQYKKGNKEALDTILGDKKTAGKEEGPTRNKPQKKELRKKAPGKKRQYKDTKWGKGGKKIKRNSKESAAGASHDGFSYKKNHSEVFKARGSKGKSFEGKGKKGKREPAKRPGKNQRRKLSSRRK